MPRIARDDMLSVAAGAVSGALSLGLGGRLAMAALPLLTGGRPSFSWGGSFEVVLLGALYGVAGGVVLAYLRRRPPHGVVRRGLLLGVLLLAAAWVTSSVGRSTAIGAPVSVLVVVALSGIPFLLYGLLAEFLRERWSAPRGGA